MPFSIDLNEHNQLLLQVAGQAEQVNVHIHPSMLPVLIQFLHDQIRRPSQKLLTDEGYLHIFLPRLALQEASLQVKYSELPKILEKLQGEANKAAEIPVFYNEALH